MRKSWIIFIIFFIIGCGSSSLYEFENKSNGKETEILHMYDTIKNPWDQKFVAVAENEKGIFLITYKNYHSKDMQKQIDEGKIPSYRGRPTFNLYGLDHAYIKEDIDASCGLKAFLKERKLQPLKCVRGWCRSYRFHTYIHIRFPSDKNANRALVRVDASSVAHQAYQNVLHSEIQRAEKEKRNILKTEAEKYLASMLKRLGLPNENIKWDGPVDDNGIPYGTGKLSMMKTLYKGSLVSFHWLEVKLSSTTIEKEKIRRGEGTVQVYRTSYVPLYSENIRFVDVGELKSAINEALTYYKNKEHQDWEQTNRYIDTMFKTEEKDMCTSYKEKCIDYCEPKSEKSSGFFSMDSKTKCKNWCESGYRSCTKNDEFWWKTYTCLGICEGVKYHEEGFLPFSTSNNNKCKKECYDNFFR
jgi:hypothetical protein